jgi:hypothetical protein
MVPDEIIVVNDGWEPVQPISGVKVIMTNGPRGLPAARAAGIKALSPDIDVVCYVDDDDEMLPDHVELLSKQINCGKHFVFSLGLHRYADGSETIDPEPGNTGPKSYYEPTALLKQNIAPPSCFMHTVEAYNKVGGWDEKCLRIEDWDLWGRMFIKYGPPGKVDKATTVIHKGHGTNLTDSNRFNYSMACSWRDIVEDRLTHLASQGRYKISKEDRILFNIPKVGIIMACTDGNLRVLQETLNSIRSQEGIDFEVLLTIPETGIITNVVRDYTKDNRFRIFPNRSGDWKEMMNFSLLVSRSEYLAIVSTPMEEKNTLRSGISFMDFRRRVGVLSGSPIIMRRRVIETIGGIETTIEDMIEKASKYFEEYISLGRGYFSKI